MGISRLRTCTDGNGITTLVAFQGCPLNCKYCINNDCHIERGFYTMYSPELLLKTVMVDDIYFRMSGGGITFGGGEPMLQSEFIKEFIEIAPKEWKIRIETSLNVDWKFIEPLIPYVDLWIIDIKDMNNDIYMAYTGVSNDLVKINLDKLASKVTHDNIYIRLPLIKGFNNEDDIKNSLDEVINIKCKKGIFTYDCIG